LAAPTPHRWSIRQRCARGDWYCIDAKLEGQNVF
jgi:hypothetical protein